MARRKRGQKTVTVKCGEVLKKHRQIAGMSVAAVSRESGISYPTVFDLENGKVPNSSVDTLAAIAKVVGVGLPDLFHQAVTGTGI